MTRGGAAVVYLRCNRQKRTSVHEVIDKANRLKTGLLSEVIDAFQHLLTFYRQVVDTTDGCRSAFAGSSLPSPLEAPASGLSAACGVRFSPAAGRSDPLRPKRSHTGRCHGGFVLHLSEFPASLPLCISARAILRPNRRPCGFAARGGRDSAGGQPGSLVAGTVRAACELGPGAGCEGRESDGNGLEWARIRPGTGWNGRESGREQPGGYLLRLGKKLGEHLCPGSGRRLGASVSRPEETAPGAGRSTLLAAASHSGSFATRLSKIQQFHNSAMPHFDDSEPNGSALRRCFIPKVLAPAASHSGSFAARWATIQQRHNSAMLHSGGSEPNDSALRLSKNNPAIRRCRIPEFAIR